MLDYALLAQESEGFSGADIKGVVDRVGESTIEAILESGEDLKITQEDLLYIIVSTTKSTAEWFSMAKNVVEYANGNGAYDALEEYMSSSKKSKKKIGFL